MSFARVFEHSESSKGKPSLEEEENLVRSTKKVKNGFGGRSKTKGKGSHALTSYKDNLQRHKEDVVTIEDGSDDEVNKGWKMEKRMFDNFPIANNTYNINELGWKVSLSDKEWEQWSKPWRKTLVVKMLGRCVNFWVLEAKLQRSWTKGGSINDKSDNFYLVKFAIEEDYNLALFEGPRMVADHYLIVQR